MKYLCSKALVYDILKRQAKRTAFFFCGESKKDHPLSEKQSFEKKNTHNNTYVQTLGIVHKLRHDFRWREV